MGTTFDESRLSVRLRKALARARIWTHEELGGRTREDVQSMWQLGKASMSFAELESYMRLEGIAFLGEGAEGPKMFGGELRDWFAGQAMSGMIAGRFRPPDIEGLNVIEAVSRAAYMYADAMIAERAKDSQTKGRNDGET